MGAGPVGSVFGEKRGVQDEGCRHVAKCSSDHRQALPEANFRDGT